MSWICWILVSHSVFWQGKMWKVQWSCYLVRDFKHNSIRRGTGCISIWRRYIELDCTTQSHKWQFKKKLRDACQHFSEHLRGCLRNPTTEVSKSQAVGDNFILIFRFFPKLSTLQSRVSSKTVLELQYGRYLRFSHKVPSIANMVAGSAGWNQTIGKWKNTRPLKRRARREQRRK